jgi:hypothetical protein
VSKKNHNANKVSTDDRDADNLTPEERKEVEKREAEKRENHKADFRTVMSTDAGRRVIWQLLVDAGIFRLSWTGNSETFFNEGQRNLGLKYLTKCETLCPNSYIDMMKESLETK